MPRLTLVIALIAAGLAGVSACSRESPAAAKSEAAVAREAAEPVRTLADFTLMDQTGQPHRLYDLKDSPAVVLVMAGVGCPIVRKMTPGLKQIVAEYSSRNVPFLMLNSNLQDTPEKIAAEAAEFELGLPVLKDADQAVGKALHAERTAEVFVLQPKTWTIVYHGPMDDRLTYGAEKPVADNHYLKDVLDAVLAGRDVPIIRQPADGCLINFS